jgi:hypothetical protein
MARTCHVNKAVFIIQYAAVHKLTVQNFGVYQAETCRLQDCTLWLCIYTENYIGQFCLLFCMDVKLGS